MKNRHLILLLGLSLMFGVISHLGYGSGKGNICGAFFKNTEKEPLPGALVALYKADTNLLVDNTYTLDNGQFTLKAPSLKGKFYIVATKGMISQKNEFEFDPAKPAQYIAVHYHDSPNRFIKVITWIIQKFDYMITTLIGLFIGLGFKWIQENKKRKEKQRKYIYTIRETIGKILACHEDLVQSFKSETNTIDIHSRYLAITREIKKNVETMEKQLNLEVFLEMPNLKNKKDGSKYYEKMRDILRKLQHFINEEDIEKVIMASPDVREKNYFQPFRDLKEQLEQNPFLKS